LGPWHCLKLKVQEIQRFHPEFSHSLTWVENKRISKLKKKLRKDLSHD
jgi:hypothetical protein